jgi:hypothetical protein
MSEIIAIDVQIKNLLAIKNAAQELGCAFLEGRTTFRTYTASQGSCAHVIRPPNWQEGDYEIGLKQLTNGAFTPYFDDFSTGRKILTALGPKCQRLTQAYKAHATILACKAKGHHTITRKTNAKTGEIKVFIQVA